MTSRSFSRVHCDGFGVLLPCSPDSKKTQLTPGLFFCPALCRLTLLCCDLEAESAPQVAMELVFN